jgi:CheY-like chemotaxis protein
VKPFRILHVDDDSSARKAIELTLGLNSTFALMGSASGDEALAVATQFVPDLIICDAMMAGMDQATAIARLRASTHNENIPTILLAGSEQRVDLDRVKSLGAATVVVKPFESAKLIGTVRDMLRSAKLAAVNYEFGHRLRNDAASLVNFRKTLSDGPDMPGVPEGLQLCVHKLAGAAGVFNFPLVSAVASAVEDAIIELRAGRGTSGRIAAELDALLECIEGA